jgi:hypothetical protein
MQQRSHLPMKHQRLEVVRQLHTQRRAFARHQHIKVAVRVRRRRRRCARFAPVRLRVRASCALAAVIRSHAMIDLYGWHVFLCKPRFDWQASLSGHWSPPWRSDHMYQLYYHTIYRTSESLKLN